MNGKSGFIGKQLIFDAGNFQMVFDVSFHIFVFEAFQMAAADDA